MGIVVPKRQPGALARGASKAAADIDTRFHPARGLRQQLNKVFPTHWSFLLGEIALYSFIVLLLSGTYLALFFDPSMVEVQYQGSFQNLQGVAMSRAYESALDISFDVRGGLLARQVHHWAALLFMAAIVVHMFRIFFTGAFRKPRETNWIIGVTLFVLGFVEGFAGYSLPDDLLSGTGLRIASGIMLSIPVIGTWVHWLAFGGEFPGEAIIPRLYTVHILLVPGLILALVAVHLGLVWYQKHTQFPGVRRTERNVVGVRILPTFAIKSLAFFAATTGVIVIMSGVFQINPIWNFGPYNAAQVSEGSQPDWYVGWLDGAARLFPPWEITLFGYVVPQPFWPTVVLPGLVFTIAALYPLIERKFTKDHASHNLLQRPRDVPVRTSLGAMAITFVMVLLIAGGDDVIAFTFDISLNAITWALRISVLLLPPIAYYLSYRVCVGLQRHDREVLAHGIETGIIKRLPDGEFIEVHQPLGPVDEDGHPIPLEYQATPVPKRLNALGFGGKGIAGSLLRADPAEETAALHRARAERRAVRPRRRPPDGRDRH
jgi:ubiquinol-cytochrome c reductase cytochrome b subunit